MPFKNTKEALKSYPNLKKYSAKARRGWVSAFNSAIDSGKDEGSAFAIAYSVANKVDGKKNINDNKKAASLFFSSTREAIQYLSDISYQKIIIAQEVAELDLDQFIKDVKSIAKVPFDDFVESVKELEDIAKDEAEKRKRIEEPTKSDLVAAGILDVISKRTNEYRKDIKDLDRIDDLSKEYQQDLSDLIERWSIVIKEETQKLD